MTPRRRNAVTRARGEVTIDRSESSSAADMRVRPPHRLTRDPADSRTTTAPGDALAVAAALGVSGLAGAVTGAQDGIAVIDVERRFVYANPAACEMFGYTLEQLRGRDFLSSIPAREHAMMAARFSAQLSGSLGKVADPFTCSLQGPDGAEREIVYSRFAVDMAGSPVDVAIFRDLTGPRAAGRAAAVLAQAAGQLVGAGTTGEILAGLARHAVEGTRALSCGITIVGDDHKLASAGAYGPDGPGYGEANPAWIDLADVPVERFVEAMTLGGVVVGDVPGKPVIAPNARAVWEASPLIRPFAVNLSTLDWQAGVFLPLSWQNRVFGFLAVFLVAGLAGPTEEELAFYTALADQAAVAVTNTRLASQARQAATLEERARLARELHDSVSQGLFSMTMHARAAQVSMAQAGLSEDGALGRSIAELAELTRGALAEMRALIFELRPAALAEEGLVTALRKQAAALTAREQLMITVDGPEEPLSLLEGAEEHLYRIACEALRNVINHAGAERVTVSLIDDADRLRVEVRDDGAGFDQAITRSGHLGLGTMAQRAATIGGQLEISSTPGTGTTVVVSVPKPPTVQRVTDPASRPEAGATDMVGHGPASSTSPAARIAGNRPRAAQGGTSDEADRVASGRGPPTLADAAALGLPFLAAVLAGAQEGIAIADSERRWVYANPAACQMLGRPLEQLRGMHILSCVPAREHDFVLGRVSAVFGGSSVRFGRVLIDAEGVEHDTVYSIGTTEIAGIIHAVAIFRDVTTTRIAARTAAALAQAASELVGAGSIDKILADIACHAVEGTRGLVCGISAVGDDDRLAEAGGYGPWSSDGGEVKNTGWAGFDDVPHGQVIKALTGGLIVLGEAPGKPLVLPDVRSVWMRYPILEPMVVTQTDDLPGVGIFVPLSWENRVFGLFTVCLPPGFAGPSEAELAFLTALADQAAVAVINARLTYRAAQAAALLERTRLARELHDSVSQGLFSMTMHARAAQLAITDIGLDDQGALGQSIAELAQLARGAMAEMRALIFELRPAGLAEEGLVAALRKQAAALSAREGTIVRSHGPEERLHLTADVEEHLYRIASEALHNVINHAEAESATVSVINDRRELRVEVRDDGAGFDQNSAHPGHLGLSTMAERARTIGATLTVTSTPGAGTSVVLTLARDGSDRDGKTAGVR
jgi:PAS domain S-box-containing protein